MVPTDYKPEPQEDDDYQINNIQKRASFLLGGLRPALERRQEMG